MFKIYQSNLKISLKSVHKFTLMMFLLTVLTTKTYAQFGANACMGASTVKFNFTGGTLISGTTNTVGARYKYANANVGGTTSIDVIAELTALQFGASVYTSARYNFNFDVPSATIGIEGNFQPSFVAVNANTFNQPANTNENLFSTWKFSFVLNSNNAIPVYVPIVAQGIDNDGVTGSGTSPAIRESVTSVTNPTSLTAASPTNQSITGKDRKSVV